jgi:hypothetical protein
MKMRILQFSAILFIMSSCGNDNQNDDYDLSHHYEPHVTKRHAGDNFEQHYYSVMLIVKNNCKVYVTKEITDNSINMTYSFNSAIGQKQAPSKTFNLSNNFELRLYEYPIEKGMENHSFFARVVEPPSDHPHEDPQGLHNGTIHTPGGS